MTDSFEFTLDNPLTEEQWDMIADVDFDHTDRIWFHTKHGKEVEFAKVRHGKWIHRGCAIFACSKCGERVGLNVYTSEKASERFKFCPNCGARMDVE